MKHVDNAVYKAKLFDPSSVSRYLKFKVAQVLDPVNCKNHAMTAKIANGPKWDWLPQSSLGCSKGVASFSSSSSAGSCAIGSHPVFFCAFSFCFCSDSWHSSLSLQRLLWSQDMISKFSLVTFRNASRNKAASPATPQVTAQACSNFGKNTTKSLPDSPPKRATKVGTLVATAFPRTRFIQQSCPTFWKMLDPAMRMTSKATTCQIWSACEVVNSPMDIKQRPAEVKGIRFVSGKRRHKRKPIVQ